MWITICVCRFIMLSKMIVYRMRRDMYNAQIQYMRDMNVSKNKA